MARPDRSNKISRATAARREYHGAHHHGDFVDWVRRREELDVLRVQLAKKEDAYRAFATDKCGMEPGSYVSVVIEDGVIVLEPEKVESSTPPAATLATVA